MSDYTEIKAVVKHIIYNNDTFYILSLNYEDEKLIAKGTFDSILVNQEYLFKGQFINHAKYGKQLNVISIEQLLPTDEDMIISYLTSSHFKGIGIKTAENIYKMFCEEDDFFDAIKSNVDRLASIRGISHDKAISIIEVIKNQDSDDGLFEYLKEKKIQLSEITTIINKCQIDGQSLIKILEDNPYTLIKKGVFIKDINKIVQRLEIEDQDIKVLFGEIYQYIKVTTFKTGSTFILRQELEDCFLNTLFEESISLLVNSGFIVDVDNCIYVSEQYDAEVFIAEFLHEYKDVYYDNDLSDYLEEYQDYNGITFNEEQLQGINYAVNSTISIITGGPGTGKSTIVDALVRIMKYLDNRSRIALCAPTGKASKRLSELTNHKAMTIHKLLKFDLHTREFGCNIFNPIEYDVVIIDEASMIDNILFAGLLKASFNVKKIIIMGDYNQLPSVSEGQILHDLIESKQIRTTWLEQIYRQKEGSRIIDLAYKVLKGREIDEFDFDNDEVSIINLNDGQNVNNIINSYIECENKNKMQFLAPIYKGRYGIDNINKVVQKMLFDTTNMYNIDDRVIQLKNRNDDEVYNGDTGKVLSFTTNEVKVKYDNCVIKYNKSDIHELRLAYCISIHKSQGNEFEHVIIFLDDSITNFIDKKLLYTGITRAKKKLTIIGDYDGLNRASHNNSMENRNTRLQSLLLGKKNYL